MVIKPSTPGLAFELKNTAWSVSKGTASAAEVVIPSMHLGLPVTEIAESGFSSYGNMTSVTIPNSVTSIGYSAFYECTGLTSVTFESTGINIDYGSFPGDLYEKYPAGGIGTYKRAIGGDTWTKQ